MDAVEHLRDAYLAQDMQKMDTYVMPVVYFYDESRDARAGQLLHLYLAVEAIIEGRFDTYCRGRASPQISDFIGVRRTAYRKLTADQIQARLMGRVASL